MEDALELAGGRRQDAGAGLSVGDLALSAANLPVPADVQQLCPGSPGATWFLKRLVFNVTAAVALSSLGRQWV